MMLLYKVMQKYGQGPEKWVAQCDTQQNAVLLIQAKMVEDQSRNDNAEYCLYEGSDLLKVFTQATLTTNTTTTAAASSSGGQGRSSSQTFQPTPFNTSPRPPGAVPNHWGKEENKDDKKE